MPELVRRSSPVIVLTLMLGAAAPAYADIEPETPKEDVPAEKGKKPKGGDCSVHDSKLGLTGLAALVLLISGAALRRRRA